MYWTKMCLFFICYMVVVGCAGKIPNPDTPIGQEEPSICVKNERFEYVNGKGRTEKFKIDYCFQQAESDEVMYFMHGAFSDENAWWKAGLANKAFPNFQKAAAMWGKKYPKVFTISFGRTWVINDEGYARTKGQDELTTKVIAELIMPALEKKHKIKDNPTRYLVGISMGGHNGYQLLTQYPQLWKKVALINAMFPKCIDPWNIVSSLPCWSSQDLRIIGSMTMLMGGYESGAHWDKNNPLGSGASRVVPTLPPTQFQYALNDEFQFMVNDKKVCMKFLEKGANAECIENPGEHDALSPELLTWFLFPELRK